MKQVAFGDPGLKYAFAGIHLNAKPWTGLLTSLLYDARVISDCPGLNFVLVNKYVIFVKLYYFRMNFKF